VPVNEGVLSGKLLHLVEKIDFLNDNETLKEVSDGGFCMAPDTLTMVYGLFAADPTMAAAHRAVRIGGDTDSNASIVASMVALIDDEEATLKRFRRRGASIALEPANTAYEVRILPPNRVRIQGKLVGLFRRY